MKALVLLVACCLIGTRGLADEPTDKTARPIRVLLTYGGHGFEQKPFYAMWDSLPGIRYTKAKLPDSADLLKPGLEKQYDVLVMYDMPKASRRSSGRTSSIS